MLLAQTARLAPRATRTWVGFLVAGLLTTAALPVLGGPPPVAVACVVVAAAIVAGVSVHRPRAAGAWLLIAGAQLAAAAPSTRLAALPLLAIGLAGLAARRFPGVDRAALLDAAVVTAGAGLVEWAYLGRPGADLAVVATAGMLLFGAGARSTAFRLLLLGVVGLVGSAYVPAGGWLHVGASVLLGAAALHPTTRWLDREAVTTRAAGRRRVVVLTAAALLPVGVLAARGTASTVLMAAAAGLFGLVVVRLVTTATAARRRALVDPVTGRPTRAFFEATLALEAERSQVLGVLLIEIDNARMLTDVYGQPAADRVRYEVAARLRDCARPGDLVARYGADRFAMLLPAAGSYTVGRVADALREAVCAERLPIDDMHAVRVTVTVGMAMLPGDADDAAGVLELAEQALGSAVWAGRNRTHTSQGQLSVAALAIAERV